MSKGWQNGIEGLEKYLRNQIEEFTPDIQQITHTDFTAQVLDGTFTPREIHVGYDFHFGEGRLGDWQYLREYFGDRVEVRPHGAVRVDGEIVGCTLVRRPP